MNKEPAAPDLSDFQSDSKSGLRAQGANTGVLPPSGPPLVPLSVALSEGVLAELAGVSLGVAEVVRDAL